ncbi:MAG: P1 family peptidase [Calditrichia bacterium]
MNFKIGHVTKKEAGTGCSVILCPPETVASAHARGAAPATREYALLQPFRKVNTIHALLLTGGSAFGLDAAAGVMKYLRERGIGYPTPFGAVPIVPAASIYDLYSGWNDVFPEPQDAYNACLAASTENRQSGPIGAGTGATVGKWAGFEFMQPGGLGRHTEKFGDLVVDVLAVVNPVGDLINASGKIVAGAQRDGRFLAEGNPKVRWQPNNINFGQNTILVALMTNARLTKLELNYLSERAHNGIVRAVMPAHTSYDGDLVFSLSHGSVTADIDQVVEMAVEATRCAILSVGEK